MGFDGIVVGDWNGHQEVEGCYAYSCAQTINAGLDMFMVTDSWKRLYKNTLNQVVNGEIAMQRLDDAVRRILRVKLRYDLFNKKKPSCDFSSPDLIKVYGVCKNPSAFTRAYVAIDPTRPAFLPSGVSIGQIRP